MRLAEWVQFRAPSGFVETTAAIAQRKGLSLSEYLRRVVTADIERESEHEDTDAVDLVREDGCRGQ